MRTWNKQRGPRKKKGKEKGLQSQCTRSARTIDAPFRKTDLQAPSFVSAASRKRLANPPTYYCMHASLRQIWGGAGLRHGLRAGAGPRL